MKTLPKFSVGVCVFCSSAVLSLALTNEPHRIAAISITLQGQPVLELAGKADAVFKNYFDLFRQEASTDLKEWRALATIVRTNAATNALAFRDETTSNLGQRFYRTVADPILTPFLPPTGPCAVGTFSRMLTDPTRTNRFRVATNSSFMASFWYPAQADATLPLAPYCDRQLAERYAYWPGYTNRVPAFVIHARANLPLAASPDPYPIIIYAHGLGDREGRGARTENTALAQELASHGYVVIAMDHNDTYATVLPTDRLILGGNAWSFNFPNDRLKDVSFLLDQLQQWNAGDPVFQGRLDLQRIGIVGWSFGGGTALGACHQEERLKAAVFLDGYLVSFSSIVSKGLTKPFLNMNASGGGDHETLFNKSPKDAYLLSIKGAAHESFTDNSWIVGPSTASRQRANAINACADSFFNRHLKGLAETLIDNPGAAYSEIINFKKK